MSHCEGEVIAVVADSDIVLSLFAIELTSTSRTREDEQVLLTGE